jgi:hypothetical protein
MYDIFFVGKGAINDAVWEEFRQRFPNAQKLENVKSFEEVKRKSFTKLFWVVWDCVIVNSEFDLSYRVPKWDEEYVHVFKNGNFYDGICIFPKQTRILQREWDYRFFTNKKEVDIVASVPRPYDIVFISYKESFADSKFINLHSKSTKNKLIRVDGVKGIHQAHIEAAKKTDTDMFYVVDADADLLEDFTFDYQIPYYDFNARSSVYVWKSKNPINNLTYGYGGVKLLPREMTIDMDLSKPDMTTSISKQFRPQDKISNITAFNTDPFNTWKSAFRECCKLASRVIDRQDDSETQQRLEAWCILNDAVPYGFYAYLGATGGKAYGETNRTNLEALKKINDFDWLQEQFTEVQDRLNGR